VALFDLPDCSSVLWGDTLVTVLKKSGDIRADGRTTTPTGATKGFLSPAIPFFHAVINT
jgi:hypothetical protein